VEERGCVTEPGFERLVEADEVVLFFGGMGLVRGQV